MSRGTVGVGVLNLVVSDIYMCEESYLSTAPNSSDGCECMVVGILVDKVKFEGVEGVGGVDHGNEIISVHRNEMCSANYTIKVDNRDRWLPVLHFTFHSPHASDIVRFFTGLREPLDEGAWIFRIPELQGKKQQDMGASH
jgi:hypothetical protein